MKRTNAILAVIAGLLMTIAGSAAYAAAPCPVASSGHTDLRMINTMPASADNSSWYAQRAAN